MKRLLGWALVSLALCGCAQTREDHQKANVRWDAWAVGVLTNHGDDNVDSCIKTLKAVETRRSELTARINDQLLAQSVREDLMVQRGQEFERAESAIAKLKARVRNLEQRIEECEAGMKQWNFDPNSESLTFDRVTKGRDMLAFLQKRVKAIDEAWAAYTKGSPLDLQ